jgi:hypothetical protein
MIAAVVGLGLTMSGCWLQAGNGAGRTYWNPDESTITAANVDDLVPLWDTDLGAASGAPISKGAVYVTTGRRLLSINAKTGAVNWAAGPYSFPDPNGDPVDIFLGPPAFDAGKVYVPYSWGYFSVDGGGTKTFAANNGDVLDDATTNRSAVDIAITGGDRIVRYHDVAGTSGLALSSIEWDYKPAIPHSVFSNQPPYPGGFAIVGERIAWSLGSQAFGYSAACPPLSNTTWCDADWKTELGGDPMGGPAAIGADQVVYGDGTGTVSVLDMTTGAVLWTGETGSIITAHVAVAGDTILVGTFDGRVVAFPTAGCGAATCAPLWEGTVGGVPLSPVTGAGEVAYVVTDAGDVVAFARGGCGAATCAPLTTIAADARPGAGVVVDSGHLYVTTPSGHLVAYGLPG